MGNGAGSTATLEQSAPVAEGDRLPRLLGLRLGVLAGPSVLATAGLLAYGLPSEQAVAELKSDVSNLRLSGNTVFTYLPDSIRASARLVAAIPFDAKVQTLLLGVVLVGLQAGWIVRWARPQLWEPLARTGSRLVGVALGSILLLATGILSRPDSTGCDGSPTAVAHGWSLRQPLHSSTDLGIQRRPPSATPPTTLLPTIWVNRLRCVSSCRNGFRSLPSISRASHRSTSST